jgi:hypothetical protein
MPAVGCPFIGFGPAASGTPTRRASIAAPAMNAPLPRRFTRSPLRIIDRLCAFPSGKVFGHA